jgi:HD-GYP domain-containing protein (c-di-GMP phosphodiesterase class II)
MKKIPVASLTPGTTIWNECYSERRELLLASGTIISQHHIDLLRKRNIFDLYMQVPSESDSQIRQATDNAIAEKKTNPPDITAGGKPDSAAATKNKSPAADAFPEEIEIIRAAQLETLLRSPSARQLDLSISRGRQVDRPAGLGLKNNVHSVSPFIRSSGYKDEVRSIYTGSILLLREFLETLLAGRSVDISPARKAVNRLLQLFIDDPDIILTMSAAKSEGDDYLYVHMVNTCILAICIATASGYNREQVLTIATGALLHDIGMPLVPKEIREKSAALSPLEFSEIQKHPVMGILMLDKIRHLQDPIRYILYQSHEREDGTGYPQKRSSRMIHRYAKIIQIADVFEALTAPRKHRAAFTPFESMEMVIRMGQRGLLAKPFVKSFLSYTSLFPVGSIVELSDHRFGRVIHANQTMFHRPIVTIIMSEENKQLSEREMYQIDLSFDENLSVIRALAPDYLSGSDLMTGF